jgi:enoyl-CoA hydratase/carnithine racemase
MSEDMLREKRNALSTAMMMELNAELSAIGKRADARAVIVAGNGPAFSAGHDLSELPLSPRERRGGADDKRQFTTTKRKKLGNRARWGWR